jgi:hypothetical protein
MWNTFLAFKKRQKGAMPVGQLSHNIWKHILSAHVQYVVLPCSQDLLFRTYRLKNGMELSLIRHFKAKKKCLRREISLKPSYNLSIQRSEELEVTHRFTQGQR